jgi:hypothetical protein
VPIPVAGSFGVTFRLHECGWTRREYASARLQILLDAATAIQSLYLRAHPEIGSPYQMGVAYLREPEGEEEWEEIPVQLAHGGADCEDLATWLAAWYQRAGVAARAVSIAQRMTTPDGRDGILFHIVVRLPNGTVIDPSADLGMHPGRATGRPTARKLSRVHDPRGAAA